MKSNGTRFFLWITLILLPTWSWAGGKESPASNVDSGSFGVFVNGKRVGTETFSITQSPSGSVTKSQFQLEGGSKIPSSSELRMSSDGSLQSYELKGDDGKSTSTVTPGDQVLLQKMTYPGKEKGDERQYILPATTFVLDDLAFIHREILAWRYIAGGCADPNCILKPESFGVLIPAEQTSMSVKLEFKGREMVSIHGKEVELARFTLSSDAGDSSLWLDRNNKMVRMIIPDANGTTEVVRD